MIGKLYLVAQNLGSGSFGDVHELVKLHGAESQKLVVKASQDVVTMNNEVDALEQVHQYA